MFRSSIFLILEWNTFWNVLCEPRWVAAQCDEASLSIGRPHFAPSSFGFPQWVSEWPWRQRTPRLGGRCPWSAQRGTRITCTSLPSNPVRAENIFTLTIHHQRNEIDFTYRPLSNTLLRFIFAWLLHVSLIVIYYSLAKKSKISLKGLITIFLYFQLWAAMQYLSVSNNFVVFSFSSATSIWIKTSEWETNLLSRIIRKLLILFPFSNLSFFLAYWFQSNLSNYPKKIIL